MYTSENIMGWIGLSTGSGCQAIFFRPILDLVLVILDFQLRNLFVKSKKKYV